MIAIKQAFSSSMRQVTPLHVFHRLCVKLNHTQEVNQRLQIVSNMVESLSDGEKFYISQKLKVSSVSYAGQLVKRYKGYCIIKVQQIG